MGKPISVKRRRGQKWVVAHRSRCEFTTMLSTNRRRTKFATTLSTKRGRIFQPCFLQSTVV